MVHLFQMTQLVQKNIIHQFDWKFHQKKRQIDILFRGATTPPRRDIFDYAGVVLKAILLRPHFQTIGKEDFGLAQEDICK